MLSTRAAIGVIFPCLWLLFAGCDGAIHIVVAGTKTATEDRSLAAPHVPGAGLDVQTDLGAVEIVADPAASEVQIAAKVTATGESEEEAKALLPQIKVNVIRRDDRVLAITVEQPQTQQGRRGGCSFKIRVPEASGVKVRTGNGAVTVEGLGGHADIHTGVGAVAVSDHGGHVTAHTGNGAVRVTKAAGDVQVNTSVGQVTVHETAGAIKAKTGNGAVELTKGGGNVAAETSVGAVTIRDSAGNVTAASGNGNVIVSGAQGAVKVRTSVGSVSLEQVAGQVETQSGNGSITYAAAAGSDASFDLKTSVGAVTVRLPPSAAGSIQAGTSVGNITVNGSRQPHSLTGGRTSKQIALTAEGPASKIHSGNGSITITLD